MKLFDQDIGAKFMGLFCGENGRGKSIAAASFAKTGRTRIFDFDGRLNAVVSYYKKHSSYFDDSQIIEIGKPIGPNNLNKFIDEFNDLEREADKGSFPWDFILLDSLTSLSMTCVTYQMLVKGNTTGKLTKGGLAVPTWDEVNGETQLISSVLDICKILPCHVIMTAHPVMKTAITDAGNIQSRALVAYGNKIGSIVPNYFNEIYQFNIEASLTAGNPPDRICWTVPTPLDFAKTAINGLPNKISWRDGYLFDIIDKICPMKRKK